MGIAKETTVDDVLPKDKTNENVVIKETTIDDVLPEKTTVGDVIPKETTVDDVLPKQAIKTETVYEDSKEIRKESKSEGVTRNIASQLKAPTKKLQENRYNVTDQSISKDSSDL